MAFIPRRTESSLATPAIPSNSRLPPSVIELVIMLISRDHRDQQSSQHIPFLRCVRTGVVQRTILHPLVEQAAGLQKLDEEWHQTQAAHRGFRRPLHMYLAREGVQAGNGLGRLIIC